MNFREVPLQNQRWSWLIYGPINTDKGLVKKNAFLSWDILFIHLSKNKVCFLKNKHLIKNYLM